MGRGPPGGQGQNRTGESPPSGIIGGPAETWTTVERGTHLAYRKSECWYLSTYRCARRRSIPTVPLPGIGGILMLQVLQGKIAVVAGASRGVGKGVALALGEAGATVYVTGRTVQAGVNSLPGTIVQTADEVTRLGGQGIAA